MSKLSFLPGTRGEHVDETQHFMFNLYACIEVWSCFFLFFFCFFFQKVLGSAYAVEVWKSGALLRKCGGLHTFIISAVVWAILSGTLFRNSYVELFIRAE